MYMVKVRSDGVVESTLYVRLMTPDMFRRYTLVAENTVSVSTRDVTVRQSTYIRSLSSQLELTASNLLCA